MMTLSPESLASAACKREYNYAADLGKPILPILITEGVSVQTLPSRLSQIQYVDYRRRDVAAALKLASALHVVPPAPAQQIDAVTLGSKDQGALIIDLRRCLRDAETEADARNLLKQLRKRNDLYANIRDEIDELLKWPAKESPGPAPTPMETRTELSVAPPGKQSTPSAAPTNAIGPTSIFERRIAAAMMGAIIGLIFGGAMLALVYEPAGPAVVSAVFGAITGALVRTSKRLMAFALAGAALASFATFFLMSQAYRPERYIVEAIAIVGAPGGALVGAIAGIVMGKFLAGAARLRS
jgi:hypothetical protein